MSTELDNYTQFPCPIKSLCSSLHFSKREGKGLKREGGTEELAFNGFSFTDKKSSVDGSTPKLMLLCYTLRSG